MESRLVHVNGPRNTTADQAGAELSVALDHVDGERLAREVIQDYPYPLAATYQRAFQVSDGVVVHDYLLDLFEVALKYCASIAISQYVADQLGDSRINASLRELERPSLGHWLGWLRDILDLYRRKNHPLRIPELGTFCSQKTTGELPAAATALRRIMVDRMGSTGGESNATAITPLQFFQLLVEYRNKLAHGVHAGPNEKRRVAEILKPALRALLQGMHFLADYPLVYVRRVEADEGDGPADSLRFAHFLTSLSSNAPWEMENPRVSGEHERARRDRLYLLDKEGDFHPLLSVHPLLIFRYCENCNREQVFLLNDGSSNSSDYLSYQCTHHFRPTEVVDDMRLLLQGLQSRNGSSAETMVSAISPTATDVVSPTRNDAAVDVSTPDITKAVAVEAGSEVDAADGQVSAGPSDDAAVAREAVVLADDPAKTEPLQTADAALATKTNSTELATNIETSTPQKRRRSNRKTSGPVKPPDEHADHESAELSDDAPAEINTAPQVSTTPRRAMKSPTLALWISLLFPGAGHLYAGQVKKGLILFALSLVAWMLVGGIGWPGLIVVAAVYYYAVTNAVAAVERVNQGTT